LKENFTSIFPQRALPFRLCKCFTFLGRGEIRLVRAFFDQTKRTQNFLILLCAPPVGGLHAFQP
jgi:hypothetical protein